LALVAICVLQVGSAWALFGFGNKSADHIGQAVKRSGELAREAELVWLQDRDEKKALALYEEAIDLCLETEMAYPKGELGSIRFNRAYCETQIDRIKFDAATGKQRSVAVMSSNKTPAPETAPTAPARQDEPTREPIKAVVAATAPPNSDTKVDAAEEIAWARDMLDSDDVSESRTALQKVLRTAPHNREAQFLMAVVASKEGEFHDAVLILEDLQAEQPSDEGYLLLAGAYLGIGEAYRAMLELDKLLQRRPTHADALMNMAYLTLELSGKTAEAATYYQMAIKYGAPPDKNFAKRLGLP